MRIAQEALAAALSQIDSSSAKAHVMRLGETRRRGMWRPCDGLLGLDIALGVGGLPRGRVTEVFGPEASGKTTLTLQVMPRCSAPAALRHSSMPSTRWIRPMRQTRRERR